MVRVRVTVRVRSWLEVACWVWLLEVVIGVDFKETKLTARRHGSAEICGALGAVERGEWPPLAAAAVAVAGAAAGVGVVGAT